MKKMIFLTYGLFLLSLTAFSYIFVDANFFYFRKIFSGFAFHNRIITTGIYIFIIILFFAFYLLFLHLTKKEIIKLNDVRYLIGLTVGSLFFSYPAMLSYDIFNYIATSKVLFFYHENPYIIMPIEFIGDPILSFTHAANKIALYGPAWIVFSIIPYIATFGNFIATLFSFKLFVILFYVSTILLIWKLSKNLYSTVFFALNPLVIVETLISGHNDIVMISLIFFSYVFLMKKKIMLTLIFFLLSILIKYATLFLLPVFIYILLKTIQKRKIDWDKTFYASVLLMLAAFLLSPFREEIYPWYAIWFLPFISLVAHRKLLTGVAVAFCFGLLFRYLPFMLSGTYSGQTPIVKTLLTFTPAIVIFIYFFIKKRLWSRKFFPL